MVGKLVVKVWWSNAETRYDALAILGAGQICIRLSALDLEASYVQHIAI